MHYVSLSLFALVCYSMVAPLVKVAIRQGASPEISVIITNTMLVTVALIWAWSQGAPFTSNLSSKTVGLLILAGVLLGLSITAYYIALSTGPLSVVVPIFGLFIVSSSIAGVIFFGEKLTWSRGLGLLCALMAIYLVSRDGIIGK